MKFCIQARLLFPRRSMGTSRIKASGSANLCFLLSYPSQVGIVYDTGRFRRDPRQLEEDEEAWFDDEEETVTPTENLTSSPDLSRLPPISAAPPPTTRSSSSSSPFTLPSYSPRPAGALTRLPLMEKKMPTISAVSSYVYILTTVDPQLSSPQLSRILGYPALISAHSI